MRNELIEIISRWDQSEPLVDHLLKNGVGVLCKNPKTNFEKLKAMSVEEFVSWVLYDKNKITHRYADSFIGLKEWLESEVQGE